MKLDLELYRRDIVVSEQPTVRLSAIDISPQNAPRTLVLLHGYGGRALQWEHQLRFFADEYRVIAPDMRGHGHSDAPPSGYTMDELQRDLETVLARLNVSERFVLAGHSFGGAVAVSYAVAHPERVERLILVGTPSDFRLHPAIQSLFRVPTPLLEWVNRTIAHDLHAPAYVLKRLYRNTLAIWPGRELLPQVKVPALVVIGQRDITFPKASQHAVAELIPGAEKLTVPVSAHLVQLERPDAVNRAIQRFLQAAPLSWREARPRSTPAPGYRWLKYYDQGVPSTIRLPSQPLHTFLESAARQRPRNVATIFYGHKLTYRQLNEQANRFANALHGLGVRKGDRVLVLLPNMPPCVVAYYGVLKAGAVVVLSSPVSAEDELVRQIDDCGAETLVTLDLFQALANRVRERCRLKHVITVHDFAVPGFEFRVSSSATRNPDLETRNFSDLLRQYPSVPPLAVDVHPDDVAVIQYTGGTTDEPKGVMLTHANLLANTLQTRAWLPDLRYGQEVFMAVLPYSHIYGQMACLNLPVSMAASIVLLPGFDVKEVLEAVKRHRPTLFHGVPSMYVAINQFPGVRKYGLSSIRACISGAAPLPDEVREAFEKLTRGRLVEGYGLTEASPVTHINPFYGQRKTGSIGIPIPGTEAKIVDLTTGLDLPPGEIGELCVRGPQVMRGYWQRPEATAQVLRDGWLYTGDVARMDEDGYFTIIDRKKDVILAGRYNVYPRDIEEVLYEHPKVMEAAVVGVPAGEDGQAIKACVVLKEGERATPEEIMAYLKSRVEEYALPRWIEFRQELPKTMVGKVLRRLLVE